jgi:phospholipid/cholesterol/gamma-HCH transport system substrate-binding protein
MARRQSRFMIGLFVTVGLLIGVAAVIWLGASKYFQNGRVYVTYFDESVQGLQVDSQVKYRGVAVGNVERIGVAPDQRLVEVVIKIDLEGDVEHTTVTQLRAAGITGIVFVELDRRMPGEENLLSPQGMRTPYTVIPSQPSQTKQMLSSVDRIMERITQLDLQGISDQLIKTSLAVETFLTGREMKGIMHNLDSTTASLDGSLRRIDRILAEGKVEGILEETRQGLGETRQGIAETRRFISGLKDEIERVKAAETMGRLNRLVEGLEVRTRRMASGFESTADDIRQTSESLRLLIERLQENPSDLIFSKPARDDRERGGEVRR